MKIKISKIFKQTKIKMKIKNISKAWYFVLIMLIIYSALYFLNPNLFNKSINFFTNIIIKIIPIFILIFFLMIIMNFFVTTKTITKHFKDKKIKAWFFAIISGIISTGPIYMWYPLLKNAQEKGVSHGLISCFLYNRAIKIFLIPIMIFYFGIKYILILSVLMIIMSIIQGITINKFLGEKQK